MLAPNTLIYQRYSIVRLIGQGGMGAVYEAYDQRLGSSVALKQLLTNGGQSSASFEREAQILARLRHSVLPAVIDTFTDANGQFLVMQFIPGEDLATALAQRGQPFPAETVLRWASQLLAGLDYLHSHQPPVVHRDIKPQNLKLTPRGEVILLDFGLAKGAHRQAHASVSRSVYGYTLQYAPLEQLHGTGTDPRSDLYALGATLYHLLTGVPPTDALARAAEVLRQRPDPLRPVHALNPQLSPKLGAALMQVMALNPDERPADAISFGASLHAAGMAPMLQPIQSLRPPASAGTSAATSRWLPWVAGGGGVLLLLVVVLLVTVLMRQSVEAEQPRMPQLPPSVTTFQGSATSTIAPTDTPELTHTPVPQIFSGMRDSLTTTSTIAPTKPTVTLVSLLPTDTPEQQIFSSMRDLLTSTSVPMQSSTVTLVPPTPTDPPRPVRPTLTPKPPTRIPMPSPTVPPTVPPEPPTVAPVQPPVAPGPPTGPPPTVVPLPIFPTELPTHTPVRSDGGGGGGGRGGDGGGGGYPSPGGQ